MINPEEAPIFSKLVMDCYDSEFRTHWERLLKKKVTSSPKNMLLFIRDVKEFVWDRCKQ